MSTFNRLFVGLIFAAVLRGAGSASGESVTPTTSMSSPRAGAQAVTLPDGRVVVIGGRNASGASVAQTEMFNPTNLSWSTVANNLTPRQENPAVLLQDGRVIAVGGTTSYWACTSDATAEVLDLVTGRWTRTPNLPAPVGSGSVAAGLPDGKILVAGGGNRCGTVWASAAIYDPVSNTWLPTGGMNVPREFASIVSLSDGRVLVAGGVTSAPFNAVASAEIYDPKSGKWSLLPSMTTARGTSCDGFVIGYLVPMAARTVALAAGAFSGSCSTGMSPTASTEIFMGASWIPGGALRSARAFSTLTPLSDTTALAAGGTDGTVFLTSIERFDMTTRTWTQVASLAMPRAEHTASPLLNGDVLFAGGVVGASGSVTASAEIFHPGSPVGPRISLTPTALTFGKQVVATASTPVTVTLSNTGDAAAKISAIATSGAEFSQTNNCPVSLGPKAVCAINVVFTPAMSGSRAGVLTVNDDAPGNPHTVALGGTGDLAPPSARLSATSLAFPLQTVGTSATKTLTLTNTGGTPLHLSARRVIGDDFTETDTCGGSLVGSASCTLAVTFAPRTSGTRAGSLSLIDDAAGSPQVIQLSGAGGVPSLKFTPAAVTFGGQLVGATASITVTLANVGNGTALFGAKAFGVSAGDFSQTNSCGTSLPAGSSCIVTVRFAPSDLGARSGTLTVTSNAPGSPQSIALSGTGQAGPCGIDVTQRTHVNPGLMTLIGSGFGSYTYSQTIRVVNTSSTTLHTPLYLVLDKLRSVTGDPVYLFGSQRVTNCGSTKGSYLLALIAPNEGLAPGKDTGTAVIFTSRGWGYSYTPIVLSGAITK